MKIFHFRRHFRLPTFGFGLSLISWQSWAQLKPKPAMIAEINGYTAWHEVTQKPVAMNPRVAMMCAAPIPFQQPSLPTVRGTQGPHRQKYIRVYVNAVGEEQMTTRKLPHFPVRSVVVKEKLPVIESKNSKTGKRQQRIGAKPELLTVMLKREKGYDAPNGDWEYVVTDGTGKQVSQRGKIQACQGCHRPFEKTDYIVRSYLPKEIEKALRDADANLATRK